jgi:hypothetical protein
VSLSTDEPLRSWFDKLTTSVCLAVREWCSATALAERMQTASINPLG